MKCGITVDKTTAPIFFDPFMPIETSSRGLLKNMANPHYNACYLSPTASRGLRRFRRTSLLYGFQDPNNEYWVPDNDPYMFLDDFLDKIKGLYNADWRLSGGKLYFKRKDSFVDDDPVYDFRIGRPDRDKILEGICYTNNDTKIPVSCSGIYTSDALDSCGNQVAGEHGAGRMNGAAFFGDKTNNPIFGDALNKDQPIGATRFRLDGSDSDYIYDALQVVLNGGVANQLMVNQFIPFAYGTWFSFLKAMAERLSTYSDYALLLSGETAQQPKILIWDGGPYENARALINKTAWPGTTTEPLPDINPTYNGPPPTAPQAWHVRHEPHTDVKGKGLLFSGAPAGVYGVYDYWGITVIERPAKLVNYPMYFEPWYLDTLWDWFHWIDDPRIKPKLGKDWRVKIRYCCWDADHLGLMNDASGIKLLQKVNLPLGYHQEGRLKEIELSFDPSDEYGQYIELRGDV